MGIDERSELVVECRKGLTQLMEERYRGQIAFYSERHPHSKYLYAGSRLPYFGRGKIYTENFREGSRTAVNSIGQIPFENYSFEEILFAVNKIRNALLELSTK